MLCSWRRQGHPRDPAEPSADGAAGSQHAGATALAGTWGERDLGDPSVLSSLPNVPSALASLGEELMYWASGLKR